MEEATHGGQRLREERERQQMSLRELAYFTGISHTMIARMERGDVNASPAIKARLARALRVRWDELWPSEVNDAP